MERSASTGPSPRSPITPAKSQSASQKASRFSTDQRQTSCGSAPGCPIDSKKRATTESRRRCSEGSHSNVPSSIEQAYHRTGGNRCALCPQFGVRPGRRSAPAVRVLLVLPEPSPELAVEHGLFSVRQALAAGHTRADVQRNTKLRRDG